MRGNKRAVCFVLAVLLALGCLGMAGCKAVNPERIVVGDVYFEDLPDFWEYTESNSVGGVYYDYAFKIDDETNVFFVFKKDILVDQYYEFEKESTDPTYKSREMLEPRTIAGREAIHYIVYYKNSKVFSRETYALTGRTGFSRRFGVTAICIERTADSQYVPGDEFEKLLDTARIAF